MDNIVPHSPRIRHEPITLICTWCGKEFKREHSLEQYYIRKKGVTLKYCSRMCCNEGKKIYLPESIAQDYQRGMTTIEIGKIYGVVGETVAKRLRELGIPLRTKSEHLSGNKNPTRGKGHTEQTKEKLREATHRQFSDPINRERASHNQYKVIANGAYKRSSKLEDIVAVELSKLGFVFARQYAIRDPHTDRYCACVDFMLDDGRVVEVNGTYWHADQRVYTTLNKTQTHNQKVYQRKMERLLSLNIPVIVLWEMDLKRDAVGTISTALSC